jgi:hypothetical protein
MEKTKDAVFVAGPPNFIDERQAYRLPDDRDVLEKLKRQQEALEGRHGGVLWALAKDDGKVLVRYALDTIPVFDGMAAAGGRLYVSTADGRVLSLSDTAADRLKKAEAQPERVAWDQPEDPGYLLPPEVPKEGDFDFVGRCKVVESDLGYRLTAKARNRAALALKKLDKPVTGSVTLKTRMAVPKGDTGMSRNGFLAFGDGTADGKLIKCGARLRQKKALLIVGPLDGGKTQSAAVEVAEGQAIDLVVAVDLATGEVTCKVGGATLETRLERPLKAITHVGYAIDNALVDFAPVEVDVD